MERLCVFEWGSKLPNPLVCGFVEEHPVHHDPNNYSYYHEFKGETVSGTPDQVRNELYDNVGRLEEIVKKVEQELRKEADRAGFDADLAQYKDGHYILADLYASLAMAQAALLRHIS